RPRSESARSTRRASASLRIPVSPGVATTARSQRSRRSAGKDDDVAIRLRPLARGGDARDVLEPLVHDLPLDRRHRVERHALARRRPLGSPEGDPLERDAAPLAVAGGVDGDRLSLATAEEDRVAQVLERVDRLAVLADQESEIAAGARDENLLVPFVRLGHGADPDRGHDALDQLAHPLLELGLVVAWRPDRRRARSARGDDTGRRVADAEQAALALGDHLEADARLVEPGHGELEVAQRLPLRLADGLARGLDRDLVDRARGAILAHRRAPPRLRRCVRGCWGRGGVGLGESPPLPFDEPP